MLNREAHQKEVILSGRKGSGSEMRKKHWILCTVCMLVCILLCACQGMASEKEPADPDTAFLEEYNRILAGTPGGRAALVCLDNDSLPELVILKDGEYQIYFFDGAEAKKISMPNVGMKANAYGTRFVIEGAEGGELTFFWFEYAPRKGLVRIHDGDAVKRRDYYLSYEGGTLKVELETDDEGGTWNTYDAEGKITNEEFSERLAEMGYDGLICCAYLYGDIETAYEHIGRESDAYKIMENFVSGETAAVEYVENRCDIPEKGFAGRSFAEINEELTAGEAWWEGLEYVDFDNDGEDELILHGYAGARLYFDVIGNRVYKILGTGATTDVSFAAEMEEKQVIVRTDLAHGGRQCYWGMTYDGCGCLTDWFKLCAVYEDEEYGAEDRFEYRDCEISMEEYEAIRDSIHEL